MKIIDFVDLNQWSEIISKSNELPKGVLVFKHSDTCSISMMAYSRIQRNWLATNNEIPFYLLEVKKYRNISNSIAEKLNIQHESPQLFLIKNGNCVYSQSHGNIDIKEAVSTID